MMIKATGLEAAKLVGFLIDTTRTVIRQNEWLGYCKRTGSPYVVVKHGKVASWVEIDLIGQNYNLHPIAAAEISALLMTHRAKKAGWWIASGKRPVTFMGGKVRKDSAEMIAAKMVGLASDPKFQVDLRKTHV